jgi:hypothetical protein
MIKREEGCTGQPSEPKKEKTMIDATDTHLSATEITQLTGLIIGNGFKRAATKADTVKRFISVLEANATGDIPQIAKGVLGGADFNQAKKILESFLSEHKSAPISKPEAQTIERKKKMTQSQAQKEGGLHRGRPSVFAGRRLTATMGHNPRKDGTFGQRSYQIILDNPGITFEKYRELGGRANDLQYDYVRDRVQVSDGDEE